MNTKINNDLNINAVSFLKITEKNENQRIDNFLIQLVKDVPKSHIWKIIRNGEVRVNKKKVDVSHKVQLYDLIRIPPISFNQKEVVRTISNKIEFPILFEDDYYLIINKPSGIACHGGSNISHGVIEQLRTTYAQLKFLELVHRIDKGTSGILILAKKRKALVELQQLIKNGNMYKSYTALTYGNWQENNIKIKAPLYKYLTKEGERRVKVDETYGQFAYSIFHIIKKFNDYTLVNAIIKTGRTHQIRVHLQYIQHPIIGDDKYGDYEVNNKVNKLGLKRMFLHATKIEFIHPITLSSIKVECSLPNNLDFFLKTLNSD